MKKSLIIFTLVLTVAFMSALPVLADQHNGGDHCGDCNDNEDCCVSDDDVLVDNSAYVINNIRVKAYTGDNYAGGSDAGDGGDGGDIEVKDGEGGQCASQTFGMPFMPFPWMGNDDGVSDSSTGNGGDGGDAGNGGLVSTGDAMAAATINNDVNTTRILIDRCACEEEEDDCGCDLVTDSFMPFMPFPWMGDDSQDCDNGCGDTDTEVDNSAHVENDGYVKADTGDNAAKGSDAGDGDDAGEIEVDGDGSVSGSDTGDGGDGGSVLDGGLVQTGDAISLADILNKINETIVRIFR